MRIGEILEVTRRSTCERINCLRNISDDANIVAPTQPQVEQVLLQGRHVLVFIDDEIAILVADPLGDRRVILHNPRGKDQNVLKIKDASIFLGDLIGIHDREHVIHTQIPRRGPSIRANGIGISIGVKHGDFRPLNFRRKIANQRLIRTDP